MTPVEKAGVISDHILLARKYGLALIYDKDSLTDTGYDLWVDHDGLTDIFILKCEFRGLYSIEVPGCEVFSSDFLEIVDTMIKLVWELAR